MEKHRRVGPFTRQMHQNENMEVAVTILREQILPNSLLTDYILNFLPLPDILSCSLTLTSKAWNTLTRDYLRRSRRRNCLMRINLFGNSKALEDRVKVLERGNGDYTREYTGVYIVIIGKGYKSKDAEAKVLEFFKNPCVLSRVTMKRLVLEAWFGNLSILTVTSAIRELLGMLPYGDIESIRILNGPADIIAGVPDPGFVKVKAIESSWSDPKEILRICPNLSKLYMDVGIDCLDVFKESGKLSVIKYLRIPDNHKLTINSEEMKMIEGGNLALKILDISLLEDSGPEQFQCISRILEQNSKSLRKFAWSANYEDIFQIQVPPMLRVREVMWDCKLKPKDIKMNLPHLRKIFPNAQLWLCDVLYEKTLR